MASLLKSLYPWVKTPLLVSAPMQGAATPALAVNVSKAFGFGFISGGKSLESLDKALEETSSLLASGGNPISGAAGTLPIGIGFQNWSCDLSVAVAAIEKHFPAAAWLFAPNRMEDLRDWSQALRSASSGKTHIWVQVGTVQEARQAVKLASPDVLVLQGTDAGGHGLVSSASVISLVPETIDALTVDGNSSIPVLAAGGICDGRGMASAMALGASGVVMGTRFLAAEEAGIAQGWKREIVRTSDGGVSTTRSTISDRLKETVGWPHWYDGRAIVNQGYIDDKAGVPDKDQIEMYQQELSRGDESWGSHGRMVAYAGTGVGLVREIKPACAIVQDVLQEAKVAASRAAGLYTSAEQSQSKL